MRWTIVLCPTLEEDYLVYSEPRWAPTSKTFPRALLAGEGRRWRRHLLGIINSVGLSLVGSTARYLWRKL